jgi:Lar family restriction alleviation protein
MSRSDAVELKPCPFCGGEAVLRYDAPEDAHDVCCYVCDYHMAAFTEKVAAITAWNTRAPSALPVRGWRDIATAPPYRVPVLLIAQYPTKTGWTDIYHGWRNAGGSNWERWPHDFQPTHWIPLPSPPSEPGVK